MKTTFMVIGVGLVVAAGGFISNSTGFAQGMMGQKMGQGMGQGRGRGMGMGQGRMGRGMMRHGKGMGRHQGNRVRHRVIMMGPGIPKAYQEAKNPLPDSAKNIDAGELLFKEQCVSCHGKAGIGNGEAGNELNPKPANIAFIMDKPIATDAFLFWSISEGGVPLGTAMPAFKEQLTKEQRWQIIHYLRTDLLMEQ